MTEWKANKWAIGANRKPNKRVQESREATHRRNRHGAKHALRKGTGEDFKDAKLNGWDIN